MPLPPPISVIIPAYNAAAHIGEALASVAGQGGGFRLEVIVVDDGSTDATREQVAAFALAVGTGLAPAPVAGCRDGGGPLQVRLIAQANAGPAAARNRGIRAAAGDLIGFLDADDCWPADRLRVQVPILAQFPRVGLVFGDCRGFDARGERALTQFEADGLDLGFWGAPVLVEDPYGKLLRNNFIPTGTVLARKDALLAVGLFDESRRLVEDLDLWLRLALHCPFAYTREVCELKRTHGANCSADRDAMALAYIEVLRDQARRAPGELRRRGLRIAPLIAFEYCLIGDRREGRGDRAGARGAYAAALRTRPSARPLYYWLRTWLRGPRSGQTQGGRRDAGAAPPRDRT